jgi:hypothetical protein
VAAAEEIGFTTPVAAAVLVETNRILVVLVRLLL